MEVTGEGDDQQRDTPADRVLRTGWGMSRRATLVAWAVFALVAVVFAGRILADDFRSHPVLGDSASYLLQAESLGFEGHNLSYDRVDLDRYRSFRWANEPYGLYFQGNDHGWAFAKPYGYSAVLAPFLRVFGPRFGVSLGNLFLLSVLGALGAATLRLRYRGAIVPLVLGVFLFASPLTFYAYHLWVELFWAPLVLGTFYALVRAVQGRSTGWALAGAALAGFLLSEKAPALPLVLPLLVVTAWTLPRWRSRVAMAGVGLLVLVVASLPYLQASSGESWTPYGGDRYYANGGTPFDAEPRPGTYSSVTSNETFSLTYVRGEIFDDIGDKAQSGIYYLVGRHTGMLGFMPLALFLLVAALAGIRRADRLGVAVVAGLVGYIGFYVVLFSNNYNGGGQTFGNRYFLQVYPAVLCLPVVMRLRVKLLAAGSAASAAVAAVFMAQHYKDPSNAIRDINETNRIQRILPFESNQDGANYFRCGAAICPEEP